jgi:squalene-associated FAD-dependent desaturase
MSSHVVIVGGGLAGLAAAVGLSGRTGVRVTLCESRPRWGGRASSFVDRVTGEPIDNCQHVALGCCTNFLHFCRTIGINRLFCREDELVFIGPDGRVSRMSAARWPAPLHLARAFAGLKFLSWHDKYRLALGLRALARCNRTVCDGVSFLEWLHRHQQTPATIDGFWHVVLVSALSETLDRIDVWHARKVIVDAFIANRHGWEVWLPTAPLDELYSSQLEAWLAARNVTPRLQCGAKRILVEQSRATGVELRSGERIDADEVILAVPQNLVLSLLPEDWQSHADLAGISRLETAPISSVHLWFDRPITELRHATFVGRQSQWLFNRSAIQATVGRGASAEGVNGRVKAQGGATPLGPPLLRGGGIDSALCIPNSELHYYQVVISASRDVVASGQEETIRAVVEELGGVWPAVREARLVHSRLVTEHKAVVSMLPGVDRLRPAQQSPIENVQLAGDWTQTGWPGTMEGAVRSGYLAAENVLARCGINASLLQPDLPVALLSKLLFGL